MSTKIRKTLSLAVGTAFAAGLAASNVAHAAQTGANPFAVSELPGGYMQVAGKEGSCGAGKMKDHKDGSCGAGKMKGTKDGKCGAGKMKGKKDGSCGEGRCGANKGK